MKYLLSLLALLTITFTMPAFAADTGTNQTALEQVTATAKQTVATNLNEVIVDILRGVKTAGGEVYTASKTAIIKSVDFTMEQAPFVVKEFVAWQIARSVVWICICVAIAILFLWVAKKLINHATDTQNDNEDFIAGWIIRICCILMIIISFGVNGMRITKVVVAPRVFLIEYVVDVIHGHTTK